MNVICGLHLDFYIILSYKFICSYLYTTPYEFEFM